MTTHEPWIRCPVCGGTNTTYAAFSAGREMYCGDCHDNHMIPDEDRPSRLQMMVDGRWDELRSEMYAELDAQHLLTEVWRERPWRERCGEPLAFPVRCRRDLSHPSPHIGLHGADPIVVDGEGNEISAKVGAHKCFPGMSPRRSGRTSSPADVQQAHEILPTEKDSS